MNERLFEKENLLASSMGTVDVVVEAVEGAKLVARLKPSLVIKG